MMLYLYCRFVQNVDVCFEVVLIICSVSAITTHGYSVVVGCDGDSDSESDSTSMMVDEVVSFLGLRLKSVVNTMW